MANADDGGDVRPPELRRRCEELIAQGADPNERDRVCAAVGWIGTKVCLEPLEDARRPELAEYPPPEFRRRCEELVAQGADQCCFLVINSLLFAIYYTGEEYVAGENCVTKNKHWGGPKREGWFGVSRGACFYNYGGRILDLVLY